MPQWQSNRARGSRMLFRTTIAGALLVLVLGSGCTAARYRQAADREAYDIIQDKQETALGEQRPFTVDTPYTDRKPDDVTAPDVIAERRGGPELALNLQDAIRTAIEHSRTYQTRKENLFLAALSLSNERHAFAPIFAADTTGTAERVPDDQRVKARTQVSLSALLKTGGNIGISIANDLLEYTTGDPRRSATSLLSVNIAQPLLRGFGSDIVAENLTQAERNVIYEVRSFTRFQRTFAVDIATRYYRLVQQQDTVRNEYSNYRNLVTARERAESLAVDRLPEFQVDQTKQDELRARNRYILAVEQYQADLDSFKLLLALPLPTRLTLDPSALDELTQRGLVPVPFGEEQALDEALVHRLDLLNSIDEVDDTRRKIVVRKDALKADLEIFGNYNIRSDPGNRWERFQASDYTGQLGVRLKLPLDRLVERNAYRRSFIDFERSLRDLALAVDEVTNDIRGALRTLDRARKNYEIQQASVALAERRVESANLLLQAGRAETRDLLEAQSAFVQAKNALTQALVDYHLARLDFLRDIGALDLTPEGIVATRELPAPSQPMPPAAQGEDLPTPDQLF